MKEIKETLAKIREEWTFFEYPQGSIEIFEKESRAIICMTSPTDINGRFDGKVIAKFPTWLASLVNQVEEMQKTLEWYANKNNYEMFDTYFNEFDYNTTSHAWQDSGERARQALKGANP